VNRGLPFRQAHHVVGRLVSQAEDQGLRLSQLPLETLREASELFEPGVYECLGSANVVRNYRPAGSAGPQQVASQLDHWKKTLGDAM
jgi:argininosuccinate lyase